jgi:competence protein ComEC
VLARGQAPFELKRWLEHDGDARTAQEAIKGGGFRCDGAGCTARMGDALVAAIRHPSAFADDCTRVRVLVAGVAAPEACRQPAVVIDYPALKREGTHALYFDGTGAIRVETVAQARGERPWAAKPAPREKPAERRSADGPLQVAPAVAPPENGRDTDNEPGEVP